MSAEKRRVWACRVEGCGLRVLDMNGQAIPMPRRWKDGVCPWCRVRQTFETEGREASDLLAEKLLGRKQYPAQKRAQGKRQGKPDKAAPPDPKPDRPEPSQGGDEDAERDRIERELRETFDPDRTIAERLGLSTARVTATRKDLRIPASPQRVVADRQRRVAAAVADHPDWPNTRIAAAVGIDAKRIASDRREIGLPAAPRQPQSDRKKPEPLPDPTPEQRALIVAAVEAGSRSDAKIAEDVGIDPRAVGRVRSALGIPSARARKQEERERRIREYVAAHPDASNYEVADALGVSSRTVQKDRLRLDLPRRAQGHTDRLLAAA
jgi:hypothetical protein